MTSFKEKYAGWLLGGGLILGAAMGCYFIFPQIHDAAITWFTGKARADAVAPEKSAPAQLLVLEHGKFGTREYGLKLNQEAIASLELRPEKAVLADKDLPLPPMIGTVNYDNERLFTVRPRFAGEVVEIKEIEYTEYPQGPTKKRPLRFGDRVKQGDTLAVLWSKDLGEKKAALVDAILSLSLSQNFLERQAGTFDEGALSLTTLKMTERQVQADMNAWRTAERTLKMWKMNDKEIQEILDEAKSIIDRKVNIKDEAKKLLERKLNAREGSKKLDVNPARSAEVEANWARVAVPVPSVWDDPTKKLVVVEKNLNRGEMVDPARDTPLFRLADLSRLQIWVHPPEEYLPMLRERLKEGSGCLKWDIRFQSDAANTAEKTLLDVAMISPSLEPNQHTPMLIGYLDNTEEKHLIGQFVTATIRVSAPRDRDKKPTTVAIPTDAINQIQGQNLVFVQNPNVTDEFMLRRVAVVQSSLNEKTGEKLSLVRYHSTAGDTDTSSAEVKKGRYAIHPLEPDERVITRGVVELTNALEELRSQQEEKNAPVRK